MPSDHACKTKTAVDVIPWQGLARSLKQWLLSLTLAMANGKARQVHALMEALVAFMASNQGHFLQMLMGTGNVEDGLRQQGASEEFISVFMDVLSVVGTGSTGRVITFGVGAGLPPVELAALLQRFKDALPPGTRSPSPGSPSPRSQPASPRLLPASSRHEAAAAAATSWEGAQALELALERVRSIEVARVPDAVVVPPSSLPPDVIRGLQRQEAVPFLFFRWLTRWLVEVLFCVQYAQTTFVVDSKLVYVGPRPETQLEGRLCLPSNEKQLLMGQDALPWSNVAGLLEAPTEESHQE